MNLLRKIAVSTLTLISPKLNTRFIYYYKFRKKLDLEHPKTLNDKILWLKFNTYWNNQLIKQCADKYAVRNYIKKCGYTDLLNELIGVYDSVDDIPWAALPNKFALKLNTGCACNLICTDKATLDVEKVKKLLKKWMRKNYYLEYSEMQYKDVKKYILIEKFLGDDDGNLPLDYKFYCFNGESKYVMVCTDRKNGKNANFFYFNREWEMQPFTREALEGQDTVIEKPDKIDEAFEIAEALSKDFPFVRVDLYIVKGKIYFGELTFTPSAGMDDSRLTSTDQILGDSLKLGLINKN